MAESDIEKPLLGPENFNRDAIDLVSCTKWRVIRTKNQVFMHWCSNFSGLIYLQERIPLEEVFEQLRTSQAGLSSTDAEARLIIFGPNKLEEKPVIFLLLILHGFSIAEYKLSIT